MICTILNFIVAFLCAYLSFNALRFDMMFSISVITVCLIMMYKMIFISPCGRGRVLYERLKMKDADTKEEGNEVMKEKEGKKVQKGTQEDKVVFRFVYADWCGYCVRTKPIWKTLEEQYPMVNGFKVDYQLLDSEDPQNKTLMKKFKVKAYPYIALEHNGTNKVYKGERSVSGFVGFLKKELR